MGSMFQDILKSIKTNFVPGSKSKNPKGGEGGDGNSGGSASGSWKNMIPDIAKAFIPDEDQDDNSTSTEDIQDDDSRTNITEIDPQATKVNAGVTENIGEDKKIPNQSPQDAGIPDDMSQDGDKTDEDTHVDDKQDDMQDSGTKADGSADNASEPGEKPGMETEKQNEKVNEGITENMGDNTDLKLMINATTDETVTTTEGADDQKELEAGVHDSAENGVHDNDKIGELSWENESEEVQGEEVDTGDGSENQKTNDDQDEAEEDTVKVNAGVTENLGNDNVNPKPVKSASADGHDVSDDNVNPEPENSASADGHDDHNNKTVTIKQTLKFEKSQSLSWESESPELLEDEMEKGKVAKQIDNDATED
ncbi:acidic repeat-containing protein-like [Mizuhopecten yessoensis]|nr:acidic repeat-containing protein-like [Mizuhopecten yessoensis]